LKETLAAFRGCTH